MLCTQTLGAQHAIGLAANTSAKAKRPNGRKATTAAQRHQSPHPEPGSRTAASRWISPGRFSLVRGSTRHDPVPQEVVEAPGRRSHTLWAVSQSGATATSPEPTTQTASPSKPASSGKAMSGALSQLLALGRSAIDAGCRNLRRLSEPRLLAMLAVSGVGCPAGHSLRRSAGTTLLSSNSIAVTSHVLPGCWSEP